jgi:DNA-binding CsgD family transcriptional regulator
MNNAISTYFYEQVQQLSKCTDTQQIQAVCGEYLHSLGGQYYKYQWNPPTIVTPAKYVEFFTCPDLWLEHYADQNYGENDPKIRYCNGHQHPASWNACAIGQKLASRHIPLQDQTFWQDTLDMGLGNGVTIPIRGMGGSKGMLCIAYECAYVENELAPLPLLEAWAMHLHTHMERLYTAEQLTSPLSQREQEVLQWTVLGKTADDIADILNLSTNTILFHLNNLRRKLHVSNKHHLIAQAFALRLVNF